MTKRKKGERRYEVYYSTMHHGQHTPDRPWCAIMRSDPGTPGEPSDGIRYMRSYETRERAVAAVAKERAFSSDRARRARQQLAEIMAEVEAKMLVVIDEETPKGPPDAG